MLGALKEETGSSTQADGEVPGPAPPSPPRNVGEAGESGGHLTDHTLR